LFETVFGFAIALVFLSCGTQETPITQEAAMQPRPFTINVPQKVLDDLTYRLDHTRFPVSSDAAGWSNGVDLAYMKDLIAYWRKGYDWRKAEKEINSLSQYQVTIDGTMIHFIHEKSKKPGAKAIIMTHGWPDSFYRFSKVIPLLTQDYDVIVPSVPGFGFSERKAMDTKATADLWAKLMKDVLGYQTFLATGADTGGPVTMDLARRHPDLVKAIYLNDAGWDGIDTDQSTVTDVEKKFLATANQWWWAEGAYISVHLTKPLSLAYGLNDSPAGLAAWAASFSNRGKSHNYVDEAFGGRDAFLTNMTIYWVTETMGTAVQTYREAMLADAGNWGQKPKPTRIDAPAALTVFPNDIVTPQEWAERRGLNIRRYTVMEKGGHFAALELPTVFAEDLRSAFEEIARD
jgi:pimeloyl-ACP methyl ester carboxylesterase